MRVARMAALARCPRRSTSPAAWVSSTCCTSPPARQDVGPLPGVQARDREIPRLVRPAVAVPTWQPRSPHGPRRGHCRHCGLAEGREAGRLKVPPFNTMITGAWSEGFRPFRSSRSVSVLRSISQRNDGLIPSHAVGRAGIRDHIDRFESKLPHRTPCPTVESGGSKQPRLPQVRSHCMAGPVEVRTVTIAVAGVWSGSTPGSRQNTHPKSGRFHDASRSVLAGSHAGRPLCCPSPEGRSTGPRGPLGGSWTGGPGQPHSRAKSAHSR